MDESIERILKKYSPGKKDGLIPLLQEIQQESGHLTDTSVREVSRHMNIPLNKIYGLATFYDQFRFNKKGRYHIQICQGATCHIQRSSSLRNEIEKSLSLKSGQTTKDGKYSLEVVNCLGACANSPVMIINGKSFSKLTAESLASVLSSLKEDKGEE